MSQSTAVRAMPRPNTRPVARPAAPPRLRVVAPRPANSTARLAVLCISLLISGLIALLLLNISIGNGAYELTALQQAQLQATEQRQALAEQVDTLSAPQQLAQRATALGMVPEPNAAFVRLSDSTVIGTAAAAKAPARKATAVLSGAQAAAAAAKSSAATKQTKSTTGTAKTPATKSGTTTTGTAKTGTAATGTAKTGTAKTGTAKPDPATPTRTGTTSPTQR